MTDDEWQEVLYRLAQFGLRIVSIDRESGTITVAIPSL